MNKNSLKIEYPKLLLLLSTFIIAYILFSGRTYPPFHNFLLTSGYLGTFLAGVFFVYGFTAAPATAILLILAKEQNIFLAGFATGFGIFSIISFILNTAGIFVILLIGSFI